MPNKFYKVCLTLALLFCHSFSFARTPNPESESFWENCETTHPVYWDSLPPNYPLLEKFTELINKADANQLLFIMDGLAHGNSRGVRMKQLSVVPGRVGITIQTSEVMNSFFTVIPYEEQLVKSRHIQHLIASSTETADWKAFYASFLLSTAYSPEHIPFAFELYRQIGNADTNERFISSLQLYLFRLKIGTRHELNHVLVSKMDLTLALSQFSELLANIESGGRITPEAVRDANERAAKAIAAFAPDKYPIIISLPASEHAEQKTRLNGGALIRRGRQEPLIGGVFNPVTDGYPVGQSEDGPIPNNQLRIK